TARRVWGGVPSIPPLASPRGRGAGPQPEFLHQHVGRRGEEDPQLIGPEATAAGAPKLEPIVEFLNPLFNMPARAVAVLVDEARRLSEVGDHKARVVARRSVREPHDFGF